MSQKEVGKILRKAREMQGILYHLPIQTDELQPFPSGKIEKSPADENQKLREAILHMKGSKYSRERQAARGLLDMLEQGKMEFSFSDWMTRNPVANKDVGFALLRVAMNFGLLEFDNGTYHFPKEIRKGPKCYHLPDKQRKILLKLMDAFPDEKFTVRNAAELTQTKYSTVGYYLENFMQRGILKVTKMAQNVNYYEFSTEVHGIFEAKETGDELAGFKQKSDHYKRVHNPFHGMADVG